MSFLSEMVDTFAQGFLEARPFWANDRYTRWAKSRVQRAFDEHAKAQAILAARRFFENEEHDRWDYCYVTVVPELRSGEIHMEIITEAGLSFTGITRSTTSGILTPLSAYREKFDRPQVL